MHPKPITIYRMYHEARASEPDLSHAEHADRMMMNFSVYMSRYETGRREHEYQIQQPGHLGQAPHLEGDALIIGDVHAPYTDYGLMALSNQIAKKHLRKPRRLIIGGDLFNQDMFSAWAAIVKPATWAQERDAVKDLIADWLRVYDEIHVIMGNHDRRLQKALDGEVDETDILAMVSSSDKIHATNYGYLTIKSGSQMWRITHPRNYGINQLTVLDQLALKHQQHVIGFHEHHLSQGWDRYGRYVIINGGCMVDTERLAYAVLDDSKSAAMKQGFVLLRNGSASLFGREPFTDWSRWL